MNLYLLRHGIAVKRSTPDRASDRRRPLTPKGRRKMVKIAAAFKGLEVQADLILTSPCVRARQTAAIAAEALGARKKLEILQALSPEVGAADLLARLSRQHLLPENILLVGHEPQLSALASLLLTGGGDLRLELKKGGLCKLNAASMRGARRAALEWLLAPRQMLAMA